MQCLTGVDQIVVMENVNVNILTIITDIISQLLFFRQKF